MASRPSFCENYPDEVVSGNIRSHPARGCRPSRLLHQENWFTSRVRCASESLWKDYGILSEDNAERLTLAAVRFSTMLERAAAKTAPSALQCQSPAAIVDASGRDVVEVRKHMSNVPPPAVKSFPSGEDEESSSRVAVSYVPSTELSSFDATRSRLYSRFAFGWWRVETLSHALSAMKAPVDLVAVRCPVDSPHRAGYAPKEHKVWVCGNLVWNPYEFRRLLAHELVHAFDFARAQIDAKNPAHIACTEVRAYNLSGECELWNTWWDTLGEDMVNYKQRCIKKAVHQSLLQHEPSATSLTGHNETIPLSPEAFRKCYNDHWPFTTKAHLDTSWRDSPRTSAV